MTINDTLNQQIQETKDKMDFLAQKLESFAEIQGNLKEAGDGLEASIAHFKELADGIQSAYDALNLSAAAIENISNILQELDPQTVSKRINDLDEKIDALSEKISRSTILGRLGVK